MKTKKPNLWYFTGPAAFVIVVWGLGWLNKRPFDIFNAITALFSGLAFAGLIYTLYQQHVELTLQRKELEDTRKELEGQKIQLELQNKHFAQQNFETTFFNMLATHRQIVNEMEIIEYRVAPNGQNYENTFVEKKVLVRCRKDLLYMFRHRPDYEKYWTTLVKNKYFIAFCNQNDSFKKLINSHSINLTKTIFSINNDEVEKYIFGQHENKSEWYSFIIRAVWGHYQPSCDYYFRHLYYILKIIKQAEDSDISKSDDKHEKYINYADLVRSQMPEYELVVLYYNALLHPKTKELLNHYDFFKNLNPEALLDPSDIDLIKQNIVL
jgi:uncharacterized membrane-anchored protein YhcB (DUF1043 family)